MLIFLFLHSADLYAVQNKTDTSELKKTPCFIRNDSIKYSVVLAVCEKCVPIKNKGYRIVVDLSQDQIDAVRKINYRTWMSLLKDEKSDWAANLILYYLYDRDAILFSLGKNRDAWLVVQKHEDIEYWIKNLGK